MCECLSEYEFAGRGYRLIYSCQLGADHAGSHRRVLNDCVLVWTWDEPPLMWTEPPPPSDLQRLYDLGLERK